MDRVRHGTGVFAARRLVYEACAQNSACTLGYKSTRLQGPVPSQQTDQKSFNELVTQAQFMIMAHGGGYDPCPKFFHAIVLGAIPIIESNPLDDAYSRFPVVILPSLVNFLQQNASIVQSQLRQWQAQYAPYYQANSTLREKTLRLLTAEYWWELIQAKYPAE